MTTHCSQCGIQILECNELRLCFLCIQQNKNESMTENYDQGENPDLSESDAEKIRQQAGAGIYSGKNQAKCSICGHEIPAPPGMCVACPTCGSNFGACG